MSGGGFVPGAKIPQVNQAVGPSGALGQSRVIIGDLDGSGGALGRSTALAGFNTESGFSTIGRGMNNPLPTSAAGRTSMLNEGLMGQVMEARRMNKLNAADPGLSTRGTRPGVGSRLRPMAPGGLEGRGVRGAPGRGSRPVTGGLEGRGVRPAPGTRRLPGSNLPVLRGSNLPAVAGSNLPAVRGGSSVTPMSPGRNLPARTTSMGPTGPSSRRPIQATYDRPAQRMLGPGPNRTSTRAPIDPGVARPAARSTGGVGDSGARGLSKMKNGRGLLIGMGAAVVAGLAYAGRREEGSSSGRSSAYRY